MLVICENPSITAARSHTSRLKKEFILLITKMDISYYDLLQVLIRVLCTELVPREMLKKPSVFLGWFGGRIKVASR